ncbi:MAG: LTA synthase family protein [Bacteroidetes bacterium]|nr:LTA synthase family protein [Bacteroidota bacterium]
MKEQIKYILKLTLFSYLLFFIQRNVFLFYFFKQTSFSLKEWALSNVYSFSMDLAMICYLLLPVTLLLFIYSFNCSRIVRQILSIFIILFIVLSNFILISDIGLYAEWGSKINHKALSYLIYPKEVIASAKSAPVLLLIVLLLLQSIPEIIIFKKYLSIDFNSRKNKWWAKTAFLIIITPLLLLGIRGGLQTFPIDRSWCYYSEKPILNQAAINSSWNCIAALVEKEEVANNPYNYMTEAESDTIFKQLCSVAKDTTSYIFTVPKPNIIIVKLEGISAEAVGALSHDIDATPQITAMVKEGLLFTNFYSTGFRTEQALAAIVAGFPSQPKTTIIRKFGKFDKMPSLAKELAANSYYTTYYYGGNLEFANIKAYLISSGFNKIIGEKDFTFRRHTNWGCFDEELFDFTVKDMAALPQPFFSIVMTSTSHEPFDNRVEKVFKGGTLVDDYLNVVHYTDASLFQFIEKAKKESWYKNTIFLIVADHTHRLPKDRQSHEIERHWIPCLIYGAALKDEYKGKTMDKYTTHVDLPAILLSQLNLKHNKFEWSKDVFNPYEKGWAFYTYNEGFGFLKDKSRIVFDHKLNKIIPYISKKEIYNSDSLSLKEGKALMQKLLNEYIKLSE